MKRRLLALNIRDTLFAHWAVDPAEVRAALPDRLEVATYDGDAYLGIVAFAVEDLRPRGFPVGRDAAQVNLRTYVRGPDGNLGTFFLSLDLDDAFGTAAARRLYRLPYYRAWIRIEREDSRSSETKEPKNETSELEDDLESGDRERTREVSFASQRIHAGAPSAHFDATYRPTGDRFRAEGGSLEEFLIEEYRLYTTGKRVYYGDLDHRSWPLYRASLNLRSTSLFEAAGLERPAGDPLAHYSPGVDAVADRLRRVT